jgi:hypothetical protein
MLPVGLAGASMQLRVFRSGLRAELGAILRYDLLEGFENLQQASEAAGWR